MRILLTGTTGKVGGYLANALAQRHDVFSVTRRQVDLQNTSALRSFLKSQSFDLLLNPAALSTPEGCENDPEAARLINIEAPRIMAEACAQKEIPFIHFSTDYVLDGNVPGFKDENAATAPNNLYGQSKLDGENAALKSYPATTIARISWVFGSAGDGFLEKVYRQIKAGESLEGVGDKYSVPTSAADLCAALETLMATPQPGRFHLTQTAEEPVSWHRYATEVSLAANELGITKAPLPVTRRTMEEIPVLQTNRPRHTAMKPSRIATELNHQMRPWQEALRSRLSEIDRDKSH